MTAESIGYTMDNWSRTQTLQSLNNGVFGMYGTSLINMHYDSYDAAIKDRPAGRRGEAVQI